MKIKSLFTFGLWTLGLWTLAVGAATPTITVTLSHFTADHSGAGYVVRLGPVTGGIARRELTDADGLASFTAVTPAIYSLSIEGAGVPTLQIRVPDTASTTAASTIVISAWTPPGTTTITSGIWENASGTIQPSAGQALNTLQFTSGAADDAANVGFVVDTEDAWTTGSLAQFRQDGTTVFRVQSDGEIVIGSTAAAIGGNAITGIRNTSVDSDSVINIDIYGIDGDDIGRSYIATDSTGGYLGLVSKSAAVTNTISISANVDPELVITHAGRTVTHLEPVVTSSGTAIAYVFDTGNQLTNGDYVVSFANTNNVRFAVDHAGAVTADDAITAGGLVTSTGFISASGYAAVGSTNRWKTGIVTTEASVVLNLTNYVNITINGVTYKLGLVQ